MTDWSLYNKRLNTNGYTKRERDLNCIKQNLTNKLTDSLSCKDVKINELDRKLMVIKTTKGHIKQINSLPNETFDCGDYVLYSDKIYLVTDVDEDDEVYTKGSMEQCNYTLKFQHPQTGIILSYPCIDGSSFMRGIDENNTISTLNGAHRIKLPFDDNTKLIGVDDRFFLDKSGTTTYKVTNVNNTTYNYGDKGLIELTMQQDVLQVNDGELPKDRVDLGICNYFEPSVEPELPVEGYSVIVTTSGDLIAGGYTARTFIPILKDTLGTVVEFTSTPIWTFDYGTMSHTDFTITYSGNNCLIKVAENYDILGMTLRVICTTADGLYSGYTDVFITTM